MGMSSEPTAPVSSDVRKVSFDDTRGAFAHLSNQELRFSYWVFKLMNSPLVVKISSQLGLLALKLHLPVTWMIKATIYRQFCGGESIVDSRKSVQKLGNAGIGAILDYSVEGLSHEKDLEGTANELLQVLHEAEDDPNIPIGCMKLSGIARFALLEKVSSKVQLTAEEQAEWERAQGRLERICEKAASLGVPMYIDAEETWIQPAIDQLAETMMQRFNSKRAIVFTTLQMYRHDRLAYFGKLIERARAEKFRLGVKLVRGAYLEKENERARSKGYPTPMQASKANTDQDYDGALDLALKHLDCVEICAGTHNEASCMLLVEHMRQKGLPNNHPHIYFSQLYGMSDYMSYNLSGSGYNVTKYLPYGPVKATVPYLIRRAEENTAIAGQMSKELRMIQQEQARRKTS
ncbi:MAG: proline dehydrogenase family protein [Salibacteraceae bacterium]